jgi:hypothetical protein
MTCEDTGLVVLDRPGPTQRPVVGEYTFDGKEITLGFVAAAGRIKYPRAAYPEG